MIFFRAFALAFCLFLTPSAPVTAKDLPRPDTQEDTLIIMRKAFLALPSITLAVIDPEEQALELTLADGQTLTSFPDNLHRILQGEETDASRRQALDDWIAGALETLEANRSLTVLGSFFRSCAPAGSPAELEKRNSRSAGPLLPGLSCSTSSICRARWSMSTMRKPKLWNLMQKPCMIRPWQT